jgi:cation transport ATPase
VVVPLNDLNKIPGVFELARRTMRVAGRNLFLGLPFNAARIIPGVTGLLNPLFAAGAKFLSIHMVVGNAPRRNPSRASMDSS